MISKAHDLPITQQCKTLDLPRSSLYYCPVAVNEDDLIIMSMIRSTAAVVFEMSYGIMVFISVETESEAL